MMMEKKNLPLKEHPFKALNQDLSIAFRQVMGRGEAGATFNWKDEIEKIYYSVKEPGSFFGPNKLYKVLKKRDKSCTLKQVIEWIRNQSVYNIHRALNWYDVVFISCFILCFICLSQIIKTQAQRKLTFPWT